jgi:hypothetical protein
MCFNGFHQGGHCGEGESRSLNQGSGGLGHPGYQRAWDKVLKMKAESIVSLAFVCGEADESARWVSLAEGELKYAFQA